MAYYNVLGTLTTILILAIGYLAWIKLAPAKRDSTSGSYGIDPTEYATKRFIERGKKEEAEFIQGLTLEFFRSKHPGSFKDGNFSRCPYCEGRQMWMKQVGCSSYAMYHSHTCKQCGKELWRSSLLNRPELEESGDA